MRPEGKQARGKVTILATHPVTLLGGKEVLIQQNVKVCPVLNGD